jgi:hypothetical protein
MFWAGTGVEPTASATTAAAPSSAATRRLSIIPTSLVPATLPDGLIAGSPGQVRVSTG